MPSKVSGSGERQATAIFLTCVGLCMANGVFPVERQDLALVCHLNHVVGTVYDLPKITMPGKLFFAMLPCAAELLIWHSYVRGCFFVGRGCMYLGSEDFAGRTQVQRIYSGSIYPLGRVCGTVDYGVV